jgi:hypothetical protein
VTEERYKLEDEIRELARQCKCYSYNGPCRFCQKMEKLERKVDRIEAEEHVIRQISQWLWSDEFQAERHNDVLTKVIHGLASNRWKKDTTPL